MPRNRHDDLIFEDHGLHDGVWRGRLAGKTAPARLCLVLDGRVWAEMVPVQAEDGGWPVALNIPAQALGDGVQVLLLLADAGDAGSPVAPDARQIGALPILAGKALDGDLRAEIALMRAEIDLLKQALRGLANR